MSDDLQDQIKTSIDNNVNETDVPGEEMTQTPPMTREEAFQVLSLKEDAKPQQIDYRFYNLTKRYRIEKDNENLAKVTAAYEIASGRAALKEAEIEEHETAKKYFGKTKREWDTYIYYSWWKYVLGVLAVIFVIFAGNQMLNGNRFDIRIVNIGHFKQDTTNLTFFAVDKLSYNNPYVINAEIGFADPTATDADAMTQSMMAFAYLSADPDIILFDEPTMPYFIDYLRNLDALYESLRLALPADVFATIEPVRYSRLDSYKLRDLKPEEYGTDPDDSVVHIYGLRFNDPKVFQALGYSTKWQSGDKLVVLGIAQTTQNLSGAELFATGLITNQEALIRQFEEINGEIVVYTGAAVNETSTVTEETDAA
jgi:hypothetical protein